MYDDYYFRAWKPHVTVAARRQQAAREIKKRLKKGQVSAPVVIEGRKIATTFWGTAWCDNLERYSDYANRLPRGRSYARNGSVIDLQIAPGVVTSLVSGSALYDVRVTVVKVPVARWKAVCADCSGAIDSVIELLQGRLSSAVMARICHDTTGLFPAPTEIAFSCSCPDWAGLCKHIAATLYGIGARLDEQPELMFTLRQVEAKDLIAQAGADLSKAKKGRSTTKVLTKGNLSEMFGIELQPDAPAVAKRPTKRAKTAARTPKARVATATAAAAKKPTARKKRKAPKVRIKPANSEAMRRYWATRKRQLAETKSRG